MRITRYKKLIATILLFLLTFYPVIAAAPGLARSAGAIWDLGEASGTRYDSVTQGVGPAAQFTSANSEYLSIADNASLSTGDIDFSITAWVYLDTKTSSRSFVWKGADTTGTNYEYWLMYTASIDRFAFLVSSPTGDTQLNADTLGSPATGTWYLIVGWHDATANTINIQINNGSVDSSAWANGSQDTTAGFKIGAQGNTPTTFHDGRIQNVGFWKRVLTASERAELYNSGKGYAYRDLSSGLKTSLQAYWNLNEAAGVRFDSQGSNDLTDNNTVTQATGVRGDNTLGRSATPYAAQFTAANSEYLSIADNASLSVGNIDFTFCGWAYFNVTTGQQEIVYKNDDATGNREYLMGLIQSAGPKFFFRVSSNGLDATQVMATSFGAPSATTWYFICGWHDSVLDTINIQINNGAVDTEATTLGVFDGTSAFRLGGTSFMDGRIAQVGFWKKVLSATERAHLYNSGKGLSYSELSRTLPSLTTSLNAYWNLSEASGTRADSAGSNNLTDNNTVTQNAGVPRGTAGTLPQAAGRGKSSIAGQFTSANSEYISIPDNATLSAGDRDFTFAAWFYPNTDADGFLITKGDTSFNGEYELRINVTTKKMAWNLSKAPSTSTTVFSTGAATIGAWNFVVVWHDSVNDTTNIKLNNAATDSLAYSAGVNDSTFPFEIGRRGDASGYFNGRLSKIGRWNKVLSAQEITDLYNSGRGNSYDGAAFYKDTAGTLKTSLQAWWELDELCCTRFDKVSPGVGPAAQFTAANSEYLSIADNAALSTGDIDFTFSAWIYLDSAAFRSIITKSQTAPTDREYQLIYQNPNVTWQVSDGTQTIICTVTDTVTLSTGTWYFYVFGHNSTTDQLTLQRDNGTINTCATSNTAPRDGTASFRIGARGDLDGEWNGRIQNVGFWKRVLTSAERTSLYNSGSGRHCKDLNDQLRRKLISYWNLNEGSGTRYDCVGANDLTDNATVTQATGVAGGNSLGDNATVTHQQGLPWWTKARASGQFTGANTEYLNRADNTDLSLGADVAFSISAWVYRDSNSGADNVFDKSVSPFGNANREYLLEYSTANNRFQFMVGNGTTNAVANATSFGALSTGTWAFVMAWHDPTGDTLNIQVNNGIVDSAAWTGGTQDTAGDFLLGKNGGNTSDMWDGRIDEVGFWKKVLTAQERTDLYNAGKANRYNGNSFEVDRAGTLTTSLTAYWTLDEASGTRYDSKGANHLTDNNTVTQNVGIDGTASAQFTAANSEYLSIPDNAALSTGDIDFTVGVWVNFDNISVSRQIFSKWTDPTNREYNLSYDSGATRFLFTVSSNGANLFDVRAHNVGQASTGIWYLVLVWHDAAADTINIQVNNGNVTNTPLSTGIFDGTSAFKLGVVNATDNFMDGRIDQVMFFKRVLTESERAALYNQSAGLSYGSIQKGFKKRGLD